MGRTRTWALAASAVAAAMLAVAPAAQATVITNERYSDDYAFEYDDCGFLVEVEGHVDGQIRIRAGKGKDATAFFAHDRFSYAETHTNPETGEFVTITGDALFNETKATRVEGSIFEFKAVEAGQPLTVYDSDGNLVSRERGSLYHHILFDTEGDDVPGGIFIEDLGTDVHGPHPTWGDGFCETLTELIGS